MPRYNSVSDVIRQLIIDHLAAHRAARGRLAPSLLAQEFPHPERSEPTCERENCRADYPSFNTSGSVNTVTCYLRAGHEGPHWQAGFHRARSSITNTWYPGYLWEDEGSYESLITRFEVSPYTIRGISDYYIPPASNPTEEEQIIFPTITTGQTWYVRNDGRPAFEHTLEVED